MSKPVIQEAHNLLIMSAELIRALNDLMVDIAVHENVSREALRERYSRIDAMQEAVYDYIMSVADIDAQIAMMHDTHITMH